MLSMILRSLPRRGYLLLVWCLASWLLVACAGFGIGQNSIDDPTPVPVTLRDPAPGQLTLALSITMDAAYDPSMRDTTTLEFQFLSHNQNVLFTGHEQFSCNGQTFDLHTLPIRLMITQKTSALAGQTLRCVYSVGGLSTTLNFTVPHPPRILSPQDQASLARGPNLLLKYDPGDGQIQTILALGVRSKASAQLDTPAPHEATLDTSSFPAGPGGIILTETPNPPVAQSGMPFAQILTGGVANAQITVNWR